MRATPMAVYGHSLSNDQLRECVKYDAFFTHSNQAVFDTIYVYCFAIGHLIRNAEEDNRAQSAFDQAYELSKGFGYVQEWMDLSHEFAAAGNWDTTKLNPIKQMGFLKHAFVLSFYALLRRLSFDDTIALAIKLGGDTDTNACIAGGMIGALHGKHALPKEKV